ncbi:MAG: heme exporter protein CcmD [Caulobacteraceae bacterium]|nr:heme exporter protein CcmD [Caulobacteraceae bacterium]
MLDLDMTPYAAFVWPAWGISALVLAGLIARAVIASRRWKRELKRLESEQMRTDETPTARAQAARSAIAQPE